jgi:hypothetical protein
MESRSVNISLQIFARATNGYVFLLLLPVISDMDLFELLRNIIKAKDKMTTIIVH